MTLGVGWVGQGPVQPRPTHPATHIRKVFLGGKMKFIKGAGNLRPILGHNFFWGGGGFSLSNSLAK